MGFTSLSIYRGQVGSGINARCPTSGPTILTLTKTIILSN
jgi:hypothetical protein